MLLAVLDSSHHLAFASSPRIEGEGGTCEDGDPLQALSVTQILPFIKRLGGRQLRLIFSPKKTAGPGARTTLPADRRAARAKPNADRIGHRDTRAGPPRIRWIFPPRRRARKRSGRPASDARALAAV